MGQKIVGLNTGSMCLHMKDVTNALISHLDSNVFSLVGSQLEGSNGGSKKSRQLYQPQGGPAAAAPLLPSSCPGRCHAENINKTKQT